MSRKWVTSSTRLALFALSAIVLFVLLLDKFFYTREEIDWLPTNVSFAYRHVHYGIWFQGWTNCQFSSFRDIYGT